MQPGNSGISISGVDQRLMAMLAELESGLRRAEAAERIIDASFGRAARPPRKREAEAGGVVSRARRALKTCDGAMIVIVFLWVASVIWCLLLFQGIGSAPNGAFAEGPERAQGAPLARGAAEEGARPPSSASTNAKAPAAEGHADGLSAEEFEREVQRVLAENRRRKQALGNSGSSAEDMGAVEDPFSLLKDQSFPEPLAPPTLAKAEPGAVAQAEAVEAPRAPLSKSAKAKATPEKGRKQRVASKPLAPASPDRADQESNGSRSFMATATDAIGGIIKSWGR